MSGYRRVNYYELCRLCTSSEGNKMNIFRDEGRRRQLQTKIQTCLPVQVLEEDSLPKIVCHECVRKLESFIEFRETVVNAEGMLESYFTSLRFSEDFLKEGKVYVKSTEKERPTTPDTEGLKSMEKMSPNVSNQPLNTEQQVQHQQPVVVSNINASNIQIISGVQARVQQYKCAMQMQAGGVAAAVVEATAETHYSYQQQTSQVSAQQPSETQNQIREQQVQNQIQTHSQLPQQPQGQAQMTQQIQQLQVQREFEKQQRHQVQIPTQQSYSVKQDTQGQSVHQNNNIGLKGEIEAEQNQQIIQKTQPDSQKNDSSAQNIQTFATVQATPEVLLSLGFKEAALNSQTVRDDAKDFKDFAKTPSEDSTSRNSIGQISEFLRIRSGSEQTTLITVNPQAISQTTRNLICRECGKTFSTMNQMNEHTCSNPSLMSDNSETQSKEDPLATNGVPFSCEICNKPFKRKEHLFQHRKLHTGERPYVCTTCSKAFSRKEHLVRHSVSHTGQKMHDCEMCGKSFSRKDNLHKHRKTHGVSGPYICETCGKSFVVKHYYLMHLTTHASAIPDGVNCQDPLPYKCDICHKAFSVKQYLMTHKLRHRSKNNNSSTHNAMNGHQQQQQQQQQGQQNNGTAGVNVISNNVTNPGTLSSSSSSNNNNGQSGNGGTVEMQSVIERNEPNNGSFSNNQYQNNMQELQ